MRCLQPFVLSYLKTFHHRECNARLNKTDDLAVISVSFPR